MSKINCKRWYSTSSCGCRFLTSISEFDRNQLTHFHILRTLSSCRRIDNEFNIFEGVFRNFWFMGIQIIIVGGQILILFIGGAAFSIHRLNAAQWAYSLILGAASIPIAIVIRLIPDELILKILPRWPQHLNNNPSLTVEDDEESIQPWNPVFEGIREELAFLKRLRGGRMSNLAYKFQHPIETLLPRSRS